ncbi:ATP:cob(I)alamin adenosyltransferase [Capsaspora owczarzaki ATCC 30864]|nr:ATP:cob(I)alamin adenosyltransferase [Capsaspora owczarzaki ATCC 30864]|eukprot:XP_004345611.1 ATP:cob(I)alamin adenosyltransferase [Capsaspora owczarzaki ATCC 30864]
MPKIYTKTGDKGTSGLFTGERRPKDDAVFEALGATDELTSALALAREFTLSVNENLAEQFETIQCVLQDIGSNVATPRTTEDKARKGFTEFDPTQVEELEQWIDAMDEQLPPLRNFILPSGGKASSAIHIARSISRRAERRVVPLVRDGEADEAAGRYLNRLSDYLFTAARYAAMLEHKPEIVYKTRAKVLEERRAKTVSQSKS